MTSVTALYYFFYRYRSYKTMFDVFSTNFIKKFNNMKELYSYVSIRQDPLFNYFLLLHCKEYDNFYLYKDHIFILDNKLYTKYIDILQDNICIVIEEDYSPYAYVIDKIYYVCHYDEKFENKFILSIIDSVGKFCIPEITWERDKDCDEYDIVTKILSVVEYDNPQIAQKEDNITSSLMLIKYYNHNVKLTFKLIKAIDEYIINLTNK